MPLITTHNYFAKDILQKIPENIANTFNKKQNIYELFAQGFDPFIFYEFFKIKKYDLQGTFHKIKTDTFFLNFIKNIKEHHLENDETILASLYGHLAHYILDSTCHPFITYKTGEYNKNKPKTYKYKGLHTKMEMQIDAYLYNQRTKKQFSTFKIHKNLITKEKISKNLLNILNLTYEQTFSLKKGGNKYQKGCKNMYYAYLLLIEDKTGFKKKIYKFIDKLTPNKNEIYEYFSSHITELDNKILNNEHNTWYNPWDNTIKSKESFFDLYKKALKEATTLIEATHNFLHNKINEKEYKSILKDKAYTTGFSWKIKKEITNLEF